MPDAIPGAARVAIVPCFNEGRNPVAICEQLLSVPDLAVEFYDDGSDGESREVLAGLARGNPRVRVTVNPVRAGKVASLLGAMRTLDPAVRSVLLVDCDVSLTRKALLAVLDELERSDLVLVDAVAMGPARNVWERGAIFSANRHDRVRNRLLDRYPALCTNGRLLGMSRRMVEAIVASDVPRHTEDAHFMLVCLDKGFRYAYRPDARISYRAPDTLDDYLRQSNRFSEGRALLRERWSDDVLARYYDPQPGDLLATALREAVRDPLGAAAFAAMLAAKAVQPKGKRTQNAAWAVASSTKVLR